jgi:triacylglycerol esterase/lipase EstA (alpha/beta hydrolase family)
MPSHSSLARLLQASCLAQLALALFWFFWRWPAAPWQAVAGAALVLFAGPLVLALEFLLLARVASRDTAVPRPTARQLAAAWWSETVHLYRTFCWRQPFRWRAEPDHLASECAGRTGVVFVHGFMCNRGFWAAWQQRLRARGHASVAVNLEPVHGPIEAYAASIDEAVARVTRITGRPPMMICHSMGGLAARAWWRETGGRRSVARLVTIASPHGGTWLGRFSRRANGRQMRLDCDWVRALAEHERTVLLPPTTCWYSNCDNIVFPAATATLGRADNRFVAGEAHVALAFCREVMQGCLALVADDTGSGQGESVTGSATENV